MARRPKPWLRKSRGWHVTINGKTHYLGQDKKEAFKKFYRLMKEPAVEKVSSDLASIIDAFLDWVSNHRSPDTFEWYRFRLQRFVNRYPRLTVSDLKPFHVQEWADSYQLSKTSVRNYMRAIKRCVKWANQFGHLSENPIAHLEVPSADHKEVFISPDDYQKFRDSITHESFDDLVVVTTESGCRPQESLHVEARHVDLKHQRWVFPKSESKGKKQPRIVYLTDPAFLITKKLMLKYPEGKLFRNANGEQWTTNLVNTTVDRIRLKMFKNQVSISEEQIQKFIPTLKPMATIRGIYREKNDFELRYEAKSKLVKRTICKHFPRYSLYALRHSWATNALQRGVDALTVAILMGHCDPSTLAKVYQHLAHNPKHLLEQAKKAVG